MESLLTFLTVIAWVLGVLSTIYTALLIYWGITYPGSLEEAIDKMNGFTKIHNPRRPFIIALICWAFIIAF